MALLQRTEDSVAAVDRPCIVDLYPRKAQFASGEEIRIAVEIRNPAPKPATVRLEADIMRLDRVVERLACEVVLPPQSVHTIELQVAPKSEAFAGFGIDAALYGEGEGGESEQQWTTPLNLITGSFDVASDWRRSIRYGFLSEFGTDEAGDGGDIAWMSKLHLNAVQFYDWMYRHDDLVPPTGGEFQDPMGRTVNIDVVREKIERCHRFGMKAIAYGAVYAACRDFYERHPDWALYDADGRVLVFIGIFHYMNIAPESPWHRHIIGEYRKAVERLDFDGIHMDTYGFPKTAYSKLAGRLRPERLDAHFPQLIDDTREELEKCKDDIGLIFNNVGNWPVEATAPAGVAAVYIEVWEPYGRYSHIRQLILDAIRFGGGKPVILAAYLKPYRNKGRRRLDGPSRTAERAHAAALLLTAAIAAHGGTHLLLGGRQGVLTEAYYVRYARMEPEHAAEIRRYYDFIVRYADLLFDRELQDVSMTHSQGDNVEYRFAGAAFSPCGEAGKLWTVLREKPGWKLLQLINLQGNDDRWNRGKRRPQAVEGVTFRILLGGRVAGVFAASPDCDGGSPRQVPWRVEPDPQGIALVVELPSVLMWCLLAVRLEE